MHCPRCDAALREGTHQGIEVGVCERCQGTLVRQRDLSTLLESLAGELYAHVTTDSRPPRVNDEHTAIGCPDCAAPMERYGYMGSRRVMIDGCAVCNALWLDAFEADAMARMWVQQDKRMERFRNAHRPADVVGMGMMLAALPVRWLVEPLFGRRGTKRARPRRDDGGR